MRLLALIFAFSLFTVNLSADCTPFEVNGQQKLNCVVVSPFYYGGKGKDWGKWYTLTAKPERPPTESYTLESATFRLEGPHPCSGDVTYTVKGAVKDKSSKSIAEILDSVRGIMELERINVYIFPDVRKGVGSWAECEQTRKTDSFVTWRFHFQGWRAEDRSIEEKSNSEIDPSCKQPEKTAEKIEYCKQKSVSFLWTSRDESVRQGAKLLTVWAKTN
jgi:hypothetical protein